MGIEIEKKKNERGDISQTSCSALFSSPQEALDLIMDPNKKEREEETTLKSEVKLSKKKRKEANELADKLESIEIEKKKNERGEISQTSCSALFSSPQEALDLIMDPN